MNYDDELDFYFEEPKKKRRYDSDGVDRSTSLTRQQVLDEFVSSMYPSKNDFSTWPPIVPDKSRIEKYSKPIIEWLSNIFESDEIFRFNTIRDLAGSAGYVVFRAGKKLSAYTTKRS